MNRLPGRSLSSKRWWFPLCLFFSFSSVSAQSLSEFKDIWIAESREFLLNNQKPLPYLQSGFHYFSRVQDDAFAEILEGKWDKFPATPGSQVPKSKKFDSSPQFSLDESSFHSPQFLPCFVASGDKTDKRDEGFNLPRIRKPEYASSNPLKQLFKFYGNSITVTYDKLLSLPVNQQLNSEIVADYWKKFQVSNSNHLIGQLMNYRDRLGLNEWGYFLLVKSCAAALYPGDESGASLLGWALMIRSGYNVRIGFNQLGASILYSSADKISGVPFVKIGDSEFYVDKPIASFPVSSYQPGHSGASGVIHLRFDRSLNFQGEILTRKMAFLWDKKTYEFNLRYQPEVIRFLEEYPHTDPKLLVDAPFSFVAGESLQRQFKPLLAGMRKEAGAAFLQQFVQKSFGYRPYNDLFGFDRFMSPEELLFKEECNDKGKALLYAWMITNLLNQQAALVEYPGFYSVAIALSQPMDGDNFLVDGKSYTIADPTYENAPIGLAMREFYQFKPLIRPLTNRQEEAVRQSKIWKLANAFGAERSGADRDYLVDETGNSYITGYFKEKNKAGAAVQTPFIAKFDPGNALAWMVKFRATGSSFGLTLLQLDQDEFYLAGSFRGELECNGTKIRTSSPSDPDLFFVQFNRLGELEWMTKTGLDQLEEDTRLFYVVQLSRSGEIQSVQLSNEDERAGRTGFSQATSEGICYVASRYQSTGLDKETEETNRKSTLLFRQHLNRMKQLGIEPTIACVAALFNSVISPGNQLNGSDLASLIPAKELSGSNSLTNLTGLLSKIKSVKNDGGIVEIFTADSTPLKTASFRVFNRARLKIIPLDNNDLTIRVIDGIEFNSGNLSEKINAFTIDLSTGNVLLDMGPGHQSVTKNLQQEILK